MRSESSKQNKKVYEAIRHESRYRTDPEYHKRHVEYSRAYQARRRKNDPVFAEKHRLRHKEYMTKKLADPEYRKKVNARRREILGWTPKEHAIEKYLVEQIQARGGFCPKFIDASRKGAPDRIVVTPGNPVHFVELKRPKFGQVEPHQQRYHDKLRACGQKVWVLRSVEEVDDFLLIL